MESTRRLQFELRRSLTSRNGDAASSEGEGGVTRNITEPDLPKVRALFERVEAKLDLMRSELIEESAREYLSSAGNSPFRSEEHTSELQSHHDLVCRLLLEKKKKTKKNITINN